MGIGVGSFADASRMAIRSATNPLDKCTIVSIMHKGYVSRKHTLEPGIFRVPSGTIEKPGILCVGPSSWFLDTDPDRPIAEIVTNSTQVAESIINDYIVGLLAFDRNGSMPGVFWVLGEKTQAQVIKDHQPELKKYDAFQKTWYRNLVGLADSLWAQSNGNPLTISDDFRIAASVLGLNKPWINAFSTVELIACVLCGKLRDPGFPICANCNHIVDPDKYKSLGLKKVE